MTEIKGLRELNNKLLALGAVKQGEALLAGAIKLQELSQRVSPRDTGFMKSTHNAREDGDDALMEVSAEYAIHVHEGTKYMHGRRWISNTIDNKTNQIVNSVAKVIKNKIEREAKK